LLTTLREGYLLLANTCGFLFHPYLTLKKIYNDRSQLAIFSILWILSWGAILFLIGLSFLISWFFPQFNLLKRLFRGTGLIGGFFLLLFSFYLIYWVVIFLRKK
jgi:hypothetical protein